MIARPIIHPIPIWLGFPLLTAIAGRFFPRILPWQLVDTGGMPPIVSGHLSHRPNVHGEQHCIRLFAHRDGRRIFSPSLFFGTKWKEE